MNNWWLPLISCPQCGYDYFSDIGTKGICPECSIKWDRYNHVLVWHNKQNNDIKIKKNINIKKLFDNIKNLFDPLDSPFSPLRALTKYRLEKFYKRTLYDIELAKNWAAHYLKGLQLPEVPVVLDHGCGRGRNVGLLNQLGYPVCGQDLGSAHPWWNHLSKSGFQVTMSPSDHLPWKQSVFDVVLNFEVIGHLDDHQLQRHASQVSRILRPKGYWLILEANSLGYNAAAHRKYYGRLHSLQTMQKISREFGFKEIDVSFEAFYAPFLPRLVNFLRKQCAPWPMDLSDYNSFLAKCISPTRRGLWLLRLQNS